MASNRFCADYAKRGTASCKKCKQKLEKGGLRLGKIVPNPFSEGAGDMKQWFHPNCMFETFVRARATTKKIDDPSDIEDWEVLTEDDKEMVLKYIGDVPTAGKTSKTSTPAKTKATPGPSKKTDSKSSTKKSADDDNKSSKPAYESTVDASHRDNFFREFRRLCLKIAEEPSYNAKTKIFSDFFTEGSDGDKFGGDLYLWVKLLLPGFVKRVYNLQSKQLVNHFAQIFGSDIDEMNEDLDKGDVADTIQKFFEESDAFPPAKKSLLTLQDVDRILEDLTGATKDEDQIRILKSAAKKCTSNDLKMIIRLIKKDLRINAGAKHVLEAVHQDAYAAFQTSRNLRDVIDRILQRRDEGTNGKPGLSKALSIRASLMTPILPMLAEACKSVEYAMKKCPNGMYAEIKYDGERVQVHKQGNDFSYFSRSLKPVMPYKVEHFKKYIPEAFPGASDLILDSEVLLIDTNTGNPLPFGTLGVHKKAAFKDAQVCLFVFDCVHLNGQNLIDMPLQKRREILEKNMVEVPNRVKFSEMKHITHPDDLKDMIMEVLRKGLEGLVLKDCMGIYEPGKRHWLKVKKDYLAEGVMADTADLVVLGAYYGTGNKGGMMSIFLMGCYDPNHKVWCTVTKVAGGNDDKTLEKLQTQLDMVKIGKDMNKVPSWLKVTKSIVPDLVCKDPKNSQVWEIIGAEFSKAEVHTANGISIRFPRVKKIRSDKTWKEATNLQELQDLFKKSKEHSSLPDVLGPRTPTKNQHSPSTSAASSPRTNSRRNRDISPSKGQKTSDSFESSPSKERGTRRKLDYSDEPLPKKQKRDVSADNDAMEAEEWPHHSRREKPSRHHLTSSVKALCDDVAEFRKQLKVVAQTIAVSKSSLASGPKSDGRRYHVRFQNTPTVFTASSSYSSSSSSYSPSSSSSSSASTRPDVSTSASKADSSAPKPKETVNARDEWLKALLGEPPTVGPKFGPPSHGQLWNYLTPMFTHHSVVEQLKDWLSSHLCPENGKASMPVPMNPCVEMAAPPDIKKMDKFLTKSQLILTSALAAGAAAVTKLSTLQTLNGNDFVAVCKDMVESCKLMAAAQHSFSLNRKHFVMSAFNPETQKVAKSTDMSKFLFGPDFADAWKTHFKLLKLSKSYMAQPKKKPFKKRQFRRRRD